MAKAKATKRPSSGARLKAAGLYPVQIWLSEAQWSLAKRAAAADGRHMTQLFSHYGLQAAWEILEKSQK